MELPGSLFNDIYHKNGPNKSPQTPISFALFLPRIWEPFDPKGTFRFRILAPPHPKDSLGLQGLSFLEKADLLKENRQNLEKYAIL